MASYYYLISSLPMLRAQGEPPMDYPAFLSQCRSAVNGGVYKTLEELSVGSDKGPLLSEWASFYGMLPFPVGRVLSVPFPGADLPAQREAGAALPGSFRP